MSADGDPDILALTSEIVAAYVSNHDVKAGEISGLLDEVHAALSRLANPETREPEVPPEPAIAIENSVTDSVIYSLEDGQPYKSLKRHLRSKYNMTPEQYRDKWNLPADYPMVAPAYARRRSQLAKKSGLGKAPR